MYPIIVSHRIIFCYCLVGWLLRQGLEIPSSNWAVTPDPESQLPRCWDYTSSPTHLAEKPHLHKKTLYANVKQVGLPLSLNFGSFLQKPELRVSIGNTCLGNKFIFSIRVWVQATIQDSRRVSNFDFFFNFVKLDKKILSLCCPVLSIL